MPTPVVALFAGLCCALEFTLPNLVPTAEIEKPPVKECLQKDVKLGKKGSTIAVQGDAKNIPAADPPRDPECN
jgi:hypothetical protein